MRRKAYVAALACLIAGAASAADEWGIENEQIARFEAKVVDVLCELTGNCPADCGAGTRQLGLLKDDDTLVLVVKNLDAFGGAVADLVGFCGKRIVADGLMINDPRMPMMALQFRREAPDGAWRRANQLSLDWAAAHPDIPFGRWMRLDEQVNEAIEADGLLGIPGMLP